MNLTKSQKTWGSKSQKKSLANFNYALTSQNYVEAHNIAYKRFEIVTCQIKKQKWAGLLTKAEEGIAEKRKTDANYAPHVVFKLYSAPTINERQATTIQPAPSDLKTNPNDYAPKKELRLKTDSDPSDAPNRKFNLDPAPPIIERQTTIPQPASSDLIVESRTTDPSNTSNTELNLDSAPPINERQAAIPQPTPSDDFLTSPLYKQYLDYLKKGPLENALNLCIKQLMRISNESSLKFRQLHENNQSLKDHCQSVEELKSLFQTELLQKIVWLRLYEHAYHMQDNIARLNEGGHPTQLKYAEFRSTRTKDQYVCKNKEADEKNRFYQEAHKAIFDNEKKDWQCIHEKVVKHLNSADQIISSILGSESSIDWNTFTPPTSLNPIFMLRSFNWERACFERKPSFDLLMYYLHHNRARYPELYQIALNEDEQLRSREALVAIATFTTVLTSYLSIFMEILYNNFQYNTAIILAPTAGGLIFFIIYHFLFTNNFNQEEPLLNMKNHYDVGIH